MAKLSFGQVLGAISQAFGVFESANIEVLAGTEVKCKGFEVASENGTPVYANISFSTTQQQAS